MKDFISQIDTQRFGFKVAKINAWDNDISFILNDLRRNGVKLVISKINCTDINLINTLEQSGFRIKDMQVAHRFNIKESFEAFTLPSDIKIRDFQKEDLQTISDIVYEAFLGYGHYFADDKLDKKQCAEIYPDWARKSCLGEIPVSKVLVAEIDGEVAGFVPFTIHEQENLKFVIPDMTAISKHHRGKGIFPSLLKGGINWSAEINAAYLETNTLTSNPSAISAFAKVGFNIVNSFITLHNWL